MARPSYLPKIISPSEKYPNGVHIQSVDAFERQLKELFLILNNDFIGEDKMITFASKAFKDFAVNRKKNFNWVFYPWLQTVVKTVSKDDYFTLKTNRNKDLITAEEQKKLAEYKVAVLGMSVGSNISLVLTQAGISREIILADFDELDTTNLNRIVAGLHQVGINKTIIAARKIYEDNPYASVTIMPDGVDEKNLEELLKKQQINCIVEEIDSVPMKIHTRRLADKYKIPVIMITDNGDGVVLHVERYDLGYDKIFNQSWEYWNDLLEVIKSSRHKLGEIIVNEIIGGVDLVDNRVRNSVDKVMKKELVSWPQLGSAAILGGVIATIAIKKIVLNQDKQPYIWQRINPNDNW